MTHFTDQQEFSIKIVIVLLTILTVAMIDMYVPSLPAMQGFFNTSADNVQLTISLYLLGFGFMHVVYGPLSDHLGRRPVILFGLYVGLISTIAAIFSKNILLFSLLRLFQGAGFASASLLARALLRDTFRGEKLIKVGSMSGVAAALSIGFSPTVGGIIEYYSNWQITFATVSIVLSITTAYTFFKLPETNLQLDKNPIRLKSSVQKYLTPLSSLNFCLITIISGLADGGLITYAIMAPFVIQEQLGYNPIQYGALSIMIAVAMALGFKINSKISKHDNLMRVTLYGGLVMLTGATIILISAIFNFVNVFNIVIGACIFTLGTGLVFTNTFIIAFSYFENVIGTVASLYGLIQMGTAFIISTIIAIIPYDSQFAMGCSYFSLSIATVLLILMTQFRIKKTTPTT